MVCFVAAKKNKDINIKSHKVICQKSVLSQTTFIELFEFALSFLSLFSEVLQEFFFLRRHIIRNSFLCVNFEHMHGKNLLRKIIFLLSNFYCYQQKRITITLQSSVLGEISRKSNKIKFIFVKFIKEVFVTYFC